jgi:hypothetical protein
MYVYFIQANTPQWQRVKIGRAKNIEARMTELQIGSPVYLKLLGKIKAQSLRHSIFLEGALHKTFDAYHVSGEWFRLSAPLREYIAAICAGNEEAARAAMQWANRQMRKEGIEKHVRERRKESRLGWTNIK